jgi:hypothetical protein
LAAATATGSHLESGQWLEVIGKLCAGACYNSRELVCECCAVAGVIFTDQSDFWRMTVDLQPD